MTARRTEYLTVFVIEWFRNRGAAAANSISENLYDGRRLKALVGRSCFIGVGSPNTG
jgi:hypothetical protein